MQGLSRRQSPAVWFPAVRTGTGTDVFTERLADALAERGIRTEIAWLPVRAEYAPKTVRAPVAPTWANVVHVNSWLHPSLLPGGVPVVSTVHHALHHPDAVRSKSLLQRCYHRHWMARIEMRNLARANVVVAVSKYAAEAAMPVAEGRRIRVIHNGVDLGVFHPGRKARRARHEAFRLLYVGKWTSSKGVDLLPRLMRSLGEGFSMCFTGPEGGIEGLPASMCDLGRLSLDQVADAMRNADALVFPSRVEGFGMVTIEAMASGLAPLTGHNCAAPEIIEHGRSGFLCDVDNVDSFVEPIRAMSADTSLLESLSQNARRRVEQEFSIELMVDRYMAVYEDLV